MPKFPGPPSRGQLAARLPPETRTLDRGTIVWRIYNLGGAHAGAWNRFRRWGPVPNMRFDPHSPPPREQSRGVLYGALRVYTCFAEVFDQLCPSLSAVGYPQFRAVDLVIRVEQNVIANAVQRINPG